VTTGAKGLTLRRSVEVARSGRVQQVEGMFDVARDDRSEVAFTVPNDLLALRDSGRDWQIGLIVGPSGAGKTTIATHIWGDHAPFRWPGDRAIIDVIPGSVKDVTALLTSVGFGSPPAWLRPYRVLSVGEQFRVNMAYAIATASESHPTVVDEYTSTVDRQVARVGSSALEKVVRRSNLQFVAVTCHFDVIDWLQPDWIYRPDSVDFEWRRLQLRPSVDLDLHEVGRDAWPIFRPHHYLSGDLHVAAKAICAVHDGLPVAYCAYYRFPHPRAKDIMVNHRTVVLPDWQGLGIGIRLINAVGQMLHRRGDRFRTTTAHPAFISSMRRSTSWREIAGNNTVSVSRKPKRLIKQHQNTRKLATKTFEYVPV
jgi:GNAT superfamily N-acetyltransferase